MNTTSTSRVSREERREAILDAARRHFVSNGYHGTGMDDVASTLGLSKPIVYQYFSSKHDLYLAVLEKAGENLEETIGAVLNQPGRNRDIVQASVRAFFEFVADDMQYYRLLFDSDMLDDVDAAERVEEVTSAVVERTIFRATRGSPHHMRKCWQVQWWERVSRQRRRGCGRLRVSWISTQPLTSLRE